MFRDPDEIAWLREHLRLARTVAILAAVLFVAYALVDEHMRPGALRETWPWRVLGGLLCMSTLLSFVPARIARWGIAHATAASMAIICTVNVVFLGILDNPAIALASQMQCFMMLAMLGPLRSMAWSGSLAALVSFNVGLALTSSSEAWWLSSNIFMVFGIAVLLGISHAAHRSYRKSRQLQDQARMQAHIVESANDAIIGCDTQGQISSWNRGAHQLFGWSAEEACTQHLSVLFSPESRPTDSRRLHKVLHDQLADHFESNWCDRDGQTREVSVTLSPVPAGAGQWSGASIIASDISIRRHAERLLHEKDAQFRTAIETSPEGFWATDPQGRIVDVNHAYCRMSGYARAELLSMHIAELEANESPEEAAAHISRVKRIGSDTFETLHRRADRSVWPVEVSTTYSAHAGGRFFVFIKDLTERKRVETLAWRQANFDTLTQLPNRALLFDRLDKACAQALRSGSSLFLLFADLDGFKDINDGHGHAAGDAVLQEVARRWLACVRAADTVARLGGDEFAVVLAGTHAPNDAQTMAQKLISALQVPMALPDGGTASVGVSIGIAAFPGDANAVDALLSRADAAMYVSKRRGKNTFSLASAADTRAG